MARTVEEGHVRKSAVEEDQHQRQKEYQLHMSDDTRQLPQAVSNATIVSVTADPERV